MKMKLVVLMGCGVLLAGCSGLHDLWGERNPVKQQYPAVPPPTANYYPNTPGAVAGNVPPQLAPMEGSTTQYQQGYQAYAPNQAHHQMQELSNSQIKNYPAQTPSAVRTAPPPNFGSYNAGNTGGQNGDVSPFERKVLSRDKQAGAQLQAYRFETSADKQSAVTGNRLARKDKVDVKSRKNAELKAKPSEQAINKAQRKDPSKAEKSLTTEI